MRTWHSITRRSLLFRSAILGSALSLLASYARLHAAPETPVGMWVPWGDPAFTVGDDCHYPWPAWGVAACKRGGAWNHYLPAWSTLGAESATLYLEIDRGLLPHDLSLLLWHTGELVSVNLCDASGAIVASDLAGDGPIPDANVSRRLYHLRLAACPSATGILIGSSGELNVYATLLFDPADPILASEAILWPAVPATPARPADDICRTDKTAHARRPTPPPRLPAYEQRAGGNALPPPVASCPPPVARLCVIAPASGSRILW